MAKERINWFLGEETSIYDPGDIPSIEPQIQIPIAAIIDDLYIIRNLIAHGERIPDSYFQRIVRRAFSHDLNILDVLQEALSFIVRKSLLRLLTESLLDHFVGAESAEAYFGAAGLTRTNLHQTARRAVGRGAEV